MRPGTPDRMLLFQLGRGGYALRLESILDLSVPGPIRTVPGAPAAVLGLTRWRGGILTVLDLRRLLDEAASTGTGRGSLVRLASPLQQTALYIDADVRLGSPAGHRHRVLEPETLVHEVENLIRDRNDAGRS